jgi:beta-glucanase (GH16 family)
MKRARLAVAAVLVTLVGWSSANAAGSHATQVSSAPHKAPKDTCGATILKADGTKWVCTFDDEFSGSTLDRAKWMPQTQGFSTGSSTAYACYVDNPANISVSGGSLNLSVIKLPAPVPCTSRTKLGPSPYTSGSVSTYHLFSQQYGRFEARMKVTSTSPAGLPGLQETFWLWPDDRTGVMVPWPAGGEMDIAELYSFAPDNNIPYLHYGPIDNGGAVDGMNTSWSCKAKRGEFNTYTLEWSPGRLEIWVNGVSCLVNTSADPAWQKPYIAAFTQGLGTGDNSYDGRIPLPATTSVDYFRVWK